MSPVFSEAAIAGAGSLAKRVMTEKSFSYVKKILGEQGTGKQSLPSSPP